jgi:hypothetical protein
VGVPLIVAINGTVDFGLTASFGAKVAGGVVTTGWETSVCCALQMPNEMTNKAINAYRKTRI